MQDKLVVVFVQILIGFAISFGITGSILCIVGPAVGLHLEFKDVEAVNIESFLSDNNRLLYFDCEAVWKGIKKESDMGISALEQERSMVFNARNPSSTLTDTCKNRKISHLTLGCCASMFTIIALCVFSFCFIYKCPEPEFVYIIPLVVSFLMILDWINTTANVIAISKNCTEYQDQKEMIDKLKFIIIWGTETGKPPGHPPRRLGVVEEGDNLCESPGNCLEQYADMNILCTKYYRCLDNVTGTGEVDCRAVNIREEPDEELIRTDKAVERLGRGLLMWLVGPILNVMSTGILLCIHFYLKFRARMNAHSARVLAMKS